MYSLYQIKNLVNTHAGQIKQIERIDTNGATNCAYYKALLFSGAVLFIKVGEKVGYEIKNRDYLNKLALPASTTLLLNQFYVNDSILVQPYCEMPTFGISMVKALHSNDDACEEYISFQANVFAKAKKLHLVDMSRAINIHLPVMNLEARMMQRLNSLLHTSIVVGGLGMNELLTREITYTQGNKKRRSIPITVMCKNISEILANVALPDSRLIHGDLHAPNIVADSNKKLYMVDFSDLMLGDPTWDYAKWINYVSRFHIITDLRKDGRSVNYDYKKILELSTPIQPRTRVTKIARKHIEKMYAKQYSKTATEARTNICIAEFIVNLSTLQRHALHYPWTFDAIMTALIEVYNEIIESVSEEAAI
jgi:thiamine kinase-like enzyme